MIPTREQIIQRVADQIYGAGILNNAHRGDVVEMMVLAALGERWKHVGLGWHPWDLQRGDGPKRVRIQVKQTAAVQLRGQTKTRTLHFGWKPNTPRCFSRDNPGEAIEKEGWFCDLSIFGIHDETDQAQIDQADPSQWLFMVIPTADLEEKMRSMQLSKARPKWRPVGWDQLGQVVDRCIRSLPPAEYK